MIGKLLGDIIAENDTPMLDRAFLETADFKTLAESSDRCVVVGRRGTGKSALAYRLKKYWKAQEKTYVSIITPDEDQIIGLRDIFSFFGDNFLHIKAAAKLSWRYALFMELIIFFSAHYKYGKFVDTRNIRSHIPLWKDRNRSLTSKLRIKLKEIISKGESPQSTIADLADELNLNQVESTLIDALEKANFHFRLLIDRLDEGYTPDSIGVAMVDGLVQTVIDLNSRGNSHLSAIVFLRDNMHRSIAFNDPDFTRNIEGQVLRLHWDEYSLFNLICNRLRIAFNKKTENNNKLWNSCCAQEMRGKEGFRIALRLTLYRPRDILVLLNNAFLDSASKNSKVLLTENIEASAKSISEHRLTDLHKEYETIFPAIDLFTSSFVGSKTKISITEACEYVETILIKDDHSKKQQRDVVFFENSLQVLQRLYGIGFIGLFDQKHGSFVFCHDGRDPKKEVLNQGTMLIHPCYWLALNTTEKDIDLENAEDIYDEYDIEISSISDEQRKSRIGSLMSEFNSIEIGKKGAYEFESWCHQVIRLIFAGSLCNIELHPNTNGLQQRDIVATNLCETPIWKRILQDYKARQIVFEIKNYSDLGASEYRQMNSYLCKEYGSLGFFITRDPDNNLRKGKDLNWTKELYYDHEKIIIKLSQKYLLKHLSKLRSPQKHDAANKELNKLLDTYIRKYLKINCR
jgi:hypothetical protein